jgi:hypothetical protein
MSSTTEHMFRYFLGDFRLSGKTFITNSNVCTYVRKVRRPTLEEESLGQRSPDQTPICRRKKRWRNERRKRHSGGETQTDRHWDDILAKRWGPKTQSLNQRKK